MSKSKHEIELTLTEFEAAVIARLLIDGVYWARSGEFGNASQEIYAALRDAGVIMANWSPQTVDRDGFVISREWVEYR